jgi:hypothetical protein
MLVHTFKKDDNLLILLVNLEEKRNQDLKSVFEEIGSSKGYHLNRTFYLTHRLTEKILYKDNYNKLHSY